MHAIKSTIKITVWSPFKIPFDFRVIFHVESRRKKNKPKEKNPKDEKRVIFHL